MTSPIPTAALEFHTAILGKTGSGKSFAAQGEVERLIAKGERVCIIDPTDRYWGLRLSPDGKRPGYEVVIFGGAHADLPLAATHGAALAEIVGTTATPVIIATRLMTVGERTRFFTDFAEALLRKNEGPLHLVIDEAHLFAPQSGAKTGGAAPAMLHAANNLVSLGRGIGLRIILISQRPAKLHKDSLTQVETLVALRLIAPQDRNAIRDWVKEWADEATGAEMMQSLPSLPTGTAWVWSPELGILHKGKFPAIATFDSGKPLASGKGPALAPIDLAAVRGKLEVVAKEAIENDPARLKRRVAELEAELRKAPKQQIDEAALAVARAEGYGRGKIEGYAEALKLAGPFIAPLRKLAAEASELAAGIEQWAGSKPAAREVAAGWAPRSPAPAAPKPAAAPRRAPAGDAAPLPRGERACLIAIAQHPDGVTREQLTVLTGYKRSSRDTYLQRLRERGLVEARGDRMMAAGAGIDALGSDYEPLPTGADLRLHWLERLPEGERRVLLVLIEAYPQPVERATIDDATGYKRSSRDTYLQRLGARELVTTDRGVARAAEHLF